MAEYDRFTTCNTILHPEMNLMFPAAKGVINPHLHWPPGTKLRVYFRTGKFPTWRMNSHPRMEFLTCGKILEMANIWRRRGGVTIPELVLTEDIQESDIRVFLSGKIYIPNFHFNKATITDTN